MWVTLIIWLLTFLLSGGAKSGQAGKAALIATGVAAAAHYSGVSADISESLGIFENEASSSNAEAPPSAAAANQNVTNGAGNIAGATSSVLNTALNTAGNVADTAIRTGGGVLQSWGPSGTVGVVAGTAAVTGSGIFEDLPSWALPVGVGLLAFAILK